MPRPGYDAGTGWLQIIPSFEGLDGVFKREAAKLAKSFEDGLGTRLEDKIKDGVQKGTKDASSTARQAGGKTGDDFSGEFQRRFTKGVEAAFKSLPKLDVDELGPELHQRIKQIREELDGLRKVPFGPDLSEDDARLLVDRYKRVLAEVEESASGSQGREFFDLRAARQQFEELGDLFRQSSTRYADTFGNTFATRVRSAIQNLPDVELDADATLAEQKLAGIRRALLELSGQTVGVDVDTGTAREQIRDLQRELIKLIATKPDMQVRVDAMGAALELREILRLGKAVDDLDPDINVSSKGLLNFNGTAGVTMSRLGYIVSLGATIGTAIIPAAAGAAASIGAIGTAALAGGAGIGVMVLAFSGIGDAVSAQIKADKQAEESAASLANAQAQVAGAADAVQSAERSLANTRESVAASNERAARQVVESHRAIQKAEQDRAEAVRGLTAAIRDARREQEDQAASAKANAISIRQAQLDVKQSKLDLDKVLANKQATADQREQAQITYDRQVQQLEDLQRRGKRMAEDQAEAHKKGIAGSEQVQRAEAKIQSATEGVQAARQRAADSEESLRQQQRQGQFQIEQAQQSVISAQRSLERATVSAGQAGGASMRNLKDAMDELSPAGQRFVKFIVGLRDRVLKPLRDTAQEALLPDLQTGSETLIDRYLKPVERYVGRVGNSLGRVFLDAVDAMEKPTWQRFFSYLSGTAVPALEGMWHGTENITRGLAALFLSLRPFNGPIGGGLLDMTEDFAFWAETLESRTGYRKFLDYVFKTGPEVIDVIGGLATTVGHLVTSAAPIGAVVLKMFQGLFWAINSIPTGILTTLIALLALGGGAMLAMTLATTGFNTVIALARTSLLVYNIVIALAAQWQARYATAVAASTASNTLFGRSMTSVGAATSATLGGMKGMLTFLGSPWGLVLTAAATAVTILWVEMDKIKQRAKENTDALRALGGEWENLKQGNLGNVAELSRQSEAFTKLVNEADRYGLQLVDLSGALQGNETALASVNKELDRRRQQLEADFRAGRVSQIWYSAEKQGLDALQGSVRATSEEERRRQEVLSNVAGQTAMAVVSDRALIDARNTLTSSTATAAEKMQAMETAIKLTTAAVDAAAQRDRAAADASYGYARAKLALSEAIDRNNWTLNLNTRAGFENTDAIKGLLEQSVAWYNTDLKNGVQTGKATEEHNKRIKALRQEAIDGGANMKVVDGLIKLYGKVSDIGTITTEVKTKGFAEVWDDLVKAQIAQKALSEMISPAEAWKKYAASYYGGFSTGSGKGVAAMKAAGGHIDGPGGPTDDQVPAWLSAGEFVQKAAAVDRYGLRFMYDLNEMRLPPSKLFAAVYGDTADDGHGHAPMFAKGGMVWPFQVNMAKTKVPTQKELKAQWLKSIGGTGAGPGFGTWPSSPSAQRGDSGVWHSVLALIKSTGPVSGTFGNAYRPGDPLWHGSGRAIDWMGYQQDALATFLAARKPLELIHRTSKRDYAYTRGRNEGSFNNSLMEQHRNHVHIAMDQGGLLQPGWNPPIWNGTGKVEPVLNPPQWDAIFKAARGGDGARQPVVNHWNFRDTTLTPSKLRAIQDADAAYERAGRAK